MQLPSIAGLVALLLKAAGSKVLSSSSAPVFAVFGSSSFPSYLLLVCCAGKNIGHGESTLKGVGVPEDSLGVRSVGVRIE